MTSPLLLLVLGILGAVTLCAAAAAAMLGNLIRCALCLAVALIGVASLYLWLGAEFLGFAQVLVYVGAVAILVVFTLLLTRRGYQAEEDDEISIPDLGLGIFLASTALGVVAIGVFSLAAFLPERRFLEKAPTVAEIGLSLMTTYAPALLAIGLVLTAALIGGLLIAKTEDQEEKP